MLIPVVITKEEKGHVALYTSSVPPSSMQKTYYVSRARASAFLGADLILFG